MTTTTNQMLVDVLRSFDDFDFDFDFEIVIDCDIGLILID